MAPSKPSLLELARELRAAVAERPGTLLAAVALTSLAALALQALSPSYGARAEIAFTQSPAELAGRLPDPARVLTSPPVLAEVERRLREAGSAESAEALPRRLTVLQPDGAERAALVVHAGSKPGARLLALTWANSFFHVRQRQIAAALAQAERRFGTDIGAASGGRRRALRQRLLSLEALGSNLPGGQLLDSPQDAGSRNLLPWRAPLAGLLLGIALAGGLGFRDGRVRTRSLLRRLGGPPLLGAASAADEGLGLAAARIASLGRRRLIVSPVDGPPGSALALARSAASEPALTGVAVELTAADEAQRSVTPDDAWLLVVPLSTLSRDRLERRFAELTAGGRGPDGMVARRARLGRFR